MKNTFSLFYGVSGDDRKRLVKTISDFTGSPAKFLGPPTFSYEVGIFNIDRFGCVSFDERADRTMVEKLIGKLQVEGFTTSHDEEPLNNRAPGPDGLMISLPLDGFNPDSLDLLQKLVDSRARLIKKALGADQLTIRTVDGKVEFPWWNSMPTPEETQAYMSFIAALSAKAKETKRVLATDREVESEKFTFRTFLLSLGFIGDEHKAARKILMKPLTGTAAFPTKAAADAFSAAQKAKRDAAKAAAATKETTEQAEEVAEDEAAE